MEEKKIKKLEDMLMVVIAFQITILLVLIKICIVLFP